MEIQAITAHFSGITGQFPDLTAENAFSLGKAFSENDLTLKVSFGEGGKLNLYANDIFVCSNNNYDEVALNMKLLMKEDNFDLFLEDGALIYTVNIDGFDFPMAANIGYSVNGSFTSLMLENTLEDCFENRCDLQASLDIVDWDTKTPEMIFKNFAKSLNGDVQPADDVNFLFVERNKDIEPLRINIPLDGKLLHLFRGTENIASVHCNNIDSQLPEFFNKLNDQLG